MVIMAKLQCPPLRKMTMNSTENQQCLSGLQKIIYTIAEDAQSTPTSTTILHCGHILEIEQVHKPSKDQCLKSIFSKNSIFLECSHQQ